MQQQQFFGRLRKLDKFKVILCKRQRRTLADGSDVYTIKGDDIHLAIDMLKDAYEDSYDCSVLISGDGDFAPLVRYVKNLKKQGKNVCFRNNISYDLRKECTTSVFIDKKIANKFFYRNKKKN